MHDELCTAYYSHLHSTRSENNAHGTTPGATHGATPLISFMSRLVSTNSSCCMAVLEAGFLDILLSLCLQDFPMDSPWLVRDPWIHDKASLLDTWDTMLTAFVSDPQASPIFLRHPVSALWPKRRCKMDLSHLRERQKGWDVIIRDPNIVELRWGGIWRVIQNLSDVVVHTTSTLDACADIFLLVRLVFSFFATHLLTKSSGFYFYSSARCPWNLMSPNGL
jgi:hypothetical protein